MRLIALVAAAMLTTGIAAAPASANGYPPPHGWHGGSHHGWHGHDRRRHDWRHHHRRWHRR